MGTAVKFESSGLQLVGSVSRPAASAAGGNRARPGLVLCHGFPTEGKRAKVSGQTYPQLADRIAAEAGWVVLTFNFRGTGESEGDFSLNGWLTDLRRAVDHMLDVEQVGGVWVAGFSTGGALALCTAAEDERVRGVASLGAPADFDDWLADPRRFLEHARSVGVIRTPGFPQDFEAWVRELRETRPLQLIGKIPPRPVLIVHGGVDDMVPLMDARALADAAERNVELRVVAGAGHALRHDPRAIAVLLGWLERQSPV
jgi:pimeloyl-ACP methyl ester carboxylesterase